MGIIGIATDIKKLGEDIVASYDTRVKAIGTLVKDTHQMLSGFHTEHKEMAGKQAKSLADFVVDLSKNVANMINGFQKDHKAMSDELKGNLEKGETDRLKDFKAMMGNIQKGIKDIENYVAKKLKEFSDAHADISEELKKELAKYVDDMVKATKKLMADIQARQKERNAGVADLLEAFKTEREQMAANWQDLVAKMDKRRGGGVVMPKIEVRKGGAVMPKIEAGEKVTTVKEAIKKPAKGKGKKMGGKKGKGTKKWKWEL